jgi:hypothetical protein
LRRSRRPGNSEWRRANGDGSARCAVTFQQRGENSWRIQVRQQGVDGRWRTISKTHHGDRHDAEAALARLLVAVDEGWRVVTPGSVRDLADRWWTICSARWSANTRAVHRPILDRHLLPAFGDLQLRKLRTVDIDGVYATLTGAVLAQRRSAGCTWVLRSMLNQAIRWDELGVNPADRMRISAEHRSGELDMGAAGVFGGDGDRCRRQQSRTARTGQ